MAIKGDTYAAVVANNQPGPRAGGSSQSQADAPPPYTPQPPTDSTPKPHGTPHQTVLPPPPQAPGRAPSAHALEAGHAHESGHLVGHSGWVPPANAAVARSRAIRRFWSAFFWGWFIWILLGMFIGGVTDAANTPSRHGHWDKNGEWHDDGGGHVHPHPGWKKKQPVVDRLVGYAKSWTGTETATVTADSAVTLE